MQKLLMKKLRIKELGIINSIKKGTEESEERNE